MRNFLPIMSIGETVETGTAVLVSRGGGDAIVLPFPRRAQPYQVADTVLAIFSESYFEPDSEAKYSRNRRWVKICPPPT